MLATIRCSLVALVSASSLCQLGLAQTFVDVTSTSGLQAVPLSYAGQGSGMCCADFDGDGDIDLVIPGTLGNPHQYFRNDGGMSFTDLTSQLALGNGAQVRGALAADIDNDGDQDFLITSFQAVPQLFINSGNATFTDEAAVRGLTQPAWYESISCGDYDRDGWLDIYFSINAGIIGGANKLYRNTGNGHFQDVTTAAGVGNPGYTYVAPFFDYNEDGWPDIYCVNDKGYGGAPNTVLRNNGNGTFTDVGVALNASQPVDGMGADFTDVFNDGGVDLYCADDPVDHLFLQWNSTTNQYDDDTYAYGLMGGGVGWAVNWLDYDNDGWQDLYVVQEHSFNRLFHNPAVPASPPVAWAEVGPALGLASIYWQWSALTADFDDDGRLDVLNLYVYFGIPGLPSCALHHNQVATGNWLKLRTRGVVSNRDGIGARVEVETGALRQRQWVRSGVGYLSGNDKRVHFGLGTATHADRVTIYWPSGQVQVLDNIAANQIVEVVEPTFELAAPVAVGGTSSLDLTIQGDEGLLYAMVLAFTRMPRSQLPDGRFLPLQLDALSSYTFIPGNTLLQNPLNYLNGFGQASSQLTIPNTQGLAGVSLFATAATVPVQGLPNIRTIFPMPVRITIQ